MALECGASSVSIHAERESDPWFHEQEISFWDELPDAHLTCVLNTSISPDTFVTSLATHTKWDHHPRYVVEPVEEEDWALAGRDDFPPIQIDSSFWVVPTWCDPVDSNATNLRLDPGLAFGSGTHPTTKLCLKWLIKHLNHGDSILDFGCGSGILGIGAKLLGAGEVVATDIDPQALESTNINAQRNQVDISGVSVSSIQGDYNLVIANILARPLMTLSAELTKYTKINGTLLLSGIMNHQVSELTKKYSDSFQFFEPETMDGWALLEGRKVY